MTIACNDCVFGPDCDLEECDYKTEQQADDEAHAAFVRDFPEQADQDAGR